MFDRAPTYPLIWNAWLMLGVLCACPMGNPPCLCGEIEELYLKEHAPVIDGKSLGLVFGKAQYPSVRRIGFERTACLGPCPVFTVYFYEDGTVQYEGFKYVPLEGKKVGKIRREYFARLCEFLHDIGLSKMEDQYHNGNFDGASTYILVETDDGTRVVRNHDYAGPKTLWAFSIIVDRLIDVAVWDEKPQHP